MTSKYHITLITTGGTIASQRGSDGVSVPVLAAAHLLDGHQGVPSGVEITVHELMNSDSACLTQADMEAIRTAVASALLSPDIDAVVVLHGTDTMEETAFLVDLHHDDDRPVIFTGAQRTADDEDPDGPSNLTAALSAAVDPANRGRGVLIAFGGALLSARGTYKAHTRNLDAFRRWPDDDPVTRHVLPWNRLSDIRVDIVALYPGADGTHVEASKSAHAHGIVLTAMGSGNTNPAVVNAVRRACQAGVVVVVSSRVPEGRLTASYGGGGGGHDLRKAGAIPAHSLRAPQARILLTALIAAHSTLSEIEDAFADAGCLIR
ncbi:MAG TPA: asparaginase [Mycobacterium sp.]|nr:asparaginase [Mycobacterium sp.]